MLFSSLIFLYVFLPITLVLTLIARKSWHNILLLLASLFFYAWGGVSYTLILLISILVNYVCGICIDHYKHTNVSRYFLIGGITVNLLLLLSFKYANFLVDNLNPFLAFLELEEIALKSIALPIGISFFTFQAISYLVDVYQGKSFVQKKLPDLALYIALFPQLIAGPIVRYHDIARQIVDRKISWSSYAEGIERFIIGLAKKVLLANNFAFLADEIFALDPGNLDLLSAWVGIICYSMQIYFDFSGYSDMAIGLGKLFGFQIPENFNFPYVAKSIKEFWRRWHISLSQWFRDYLYIPLGGNRISPMRTYINLIIVFFLTGFWHGASWNFIFWGLFHGFFLILERGAFGKWLDRTWAGIQHFYLLLVVMIGWVFFRANDFTHGWAYLKAMFSIRNSTSGSFDLVFYWNYELSLAFIIGILASTPIFNLLQNNQWKLSTTYQLASTIGLLFLFLWCTMNLATSSYNPFIYFRF